MFSTCSEICLCSKQDKAANTAILPSGGKEAGADPKEPNAAGLTNSGSPKNGDSEANAGSPAGKPRRLTVNARAPPPDGTDSYSMPPPPIQEDALSPTNDTMTPKSSSPKSGKKKRGSTIGAVSAGGIEIPEMTPEEAACSQASASSSMPSPAELLGEVLRPAQLFDLVPHQFMCFGSSFEGKMGAARIEPEFTEKELEVSGGMDPSAMRQELVKFGIGVCCKKGKKPEQPNQDNIFFCKMDNFTICGVADGHGPDGHWASHWIARFVLRLLLPEVNTKKEAPTDEAFARIFDVVHQALVIRSKNDRFDLQMSGSTLSMCIVDHSKRNVVAAWCGDSRCAIGRPNGSDAGDLTNDHKPQDREEKQRITNSGGEVVRLEGDVPHRVFVRGGEVPGLAMSRAIGDCVAHSVGVNHVPGIVRKDLQDHFVLCCSDGVWEFITGAQAAKIVMQAGGRQKIDEATHQLTKEARNRWLKEEEYLTDDISAIAIFL